MFLSSAWILVAQVPFGIMFKFQFLVKFLEDHLPQPVIVCFLVVFHMSVKDSKYLFSILLLIFSLFQAFFQAIQKSSSNTNYNWYHQNLQVLHFLVLWQDLCIWLHIDFFHFLVFTGRGKSTSRQILFFLLINTRFDVLTGIR